MEMKRKEKTLFRLFLKYVVLFCVNTILLAAGVFLLMLWAASVGLLLPANYAEMQLSENAEEICRAGTEIDGDAGAGGEAEIAEDTETEKGAGTEGDTEKEGGAETEAGNSLEQWIPKGCTYGVYSSEGKWLAGNFPRQEQESAWNHYEKNYIYAEYKGYYRFFPMDNGNVCIVKYHLVMRYASDRLNELFLAPETLMPVVDLLLFVLNAVLLSRRFAKKVGKRLQELQAITEKIAGNDLAFETKASDIKEINEIMTSLGRMKDTLQESLKAQWDMEKQRQEQLSALTHDIKTPLTIIRGNSELLKESVLSEENQECAGYILANVEEIEKYLETMREVIDSPGKEKEKETEKGAISCKLLEADLWEMAGQLAKAEKIPVSFTAGILEEEESSGERVCCSLANILRAWSNIVSNGAEHTDRQRGIEILTERRRKGEQVYLRAAVRDCGPGFSKKDLQYADQEFYSGDISRHDRRHSGLGLSIAKKFVEEQGGFLEYGNRRDGAGAEVALWLRHCGRDTGDCRNR